MGVCVQGNRVCVPPALHARLSPCTTSKFMTQIHCPKVKRLNHAHAYNCSLSLKKVARVPIPQPSSVTMLIPYSVYWRVIWMNLGHNKLPTDIAQLLCISEHMVRWYLTLFYTGDLEQILYEWTQVAARRLWATRPTTADSCLSRYILYMTKILPSPATFVLQKYSVE